MDVTKYVCALLFCLISSIYGFTIPTTLIAGTDQKPYGDNGYNCTFSLDTCGWTQDHNGDDFDWTIHSGPTLSTFTGPDNDHTSLWCPDCLGYYMYIETSKRRISDQARIIGPPIYISMGESMCFSFWYHMYGSGIGRLSVFEQQESNTTMIWTKTNNQGPQWLYADVTITGSGRPQQILIDGIRGNSYPGDIAIDDTELRPGQCGDEQFEITTGSYEPITDSYEPTIESYEATEESYETSTDRYGPTTESYESYEVTTQVSGTLSPYKDNGYNCTFSLDTCGWNQDHNGDDFDWTFHSGPTPSEQTGPDNDHTSLWCTDCLGNYMYIETSKTRTSEHARIIGPSIYISMGESMCFSFWYHMYGSGIGRLSIYELQEGLRTFIWTKIYDRGPQWLYADVTITGSGRPKQILIEGISGAGYQGDIAIDDTELRPGQCGDGQPELTTSSFGRTTESYESYEVTTQVSGTLSPYKGDRLDASIIVDCNKYTWDIIVDLDQLRQVYPKAKGSDIYLGENKCSGIEKNNLLIFNQELTECLTSETLINGVHVYNNELIYAEHDPVYLYIIRHYNWTVGVECDVHRDGTANSSLQKPDEYTPSPSVYSQQYSVNISYYSDPNFVHEIQGNPLHVNVGSQVYVKVFTTTVDWNTKMRVHTCYTTPTEHALDHLKYYLIRNGCEVDTNTHITSQSTHETRLVFDDFEYTSSHSGLYVYCDVTFCASTDWSTNCRQTCQPVVRRKR